jgi:uncharacterized membrane protein
MSEIVMKARTFLFAPQKLSTIISCGLAPRATAAQFAFLLLFDSAGVLTGERVCSTIFYHGACFRLC